MGIIYCDSKIKTKTKKVYSWVWNTVGGALFLKALDPGSILGIPYCAQSPIRSFLFTELGVTLEHGRVWLKNLRNI